MMHPRKIYVFMETNSGGLMFWRSTDSVAQAQELINEHIAADNTFGGLVDLGSNADDRFAIFEANWTEKKRHVGRTIPTQRIMSSTPRA